MKIDPVIKKETGFIALGVGALCLLMLIVYAVLKKLVIGVFLGTALGFCATVGNFFLMALSVQKSAEKMNGVHIAEKQDGDETDEENGEEKDEPLSPEAISAKKLMQKSYYARLVLLAVVAILAVTLPFVDAVPCLISLLFPRIAIYIIQFIRNKKEAKA